MKSGLIGHTGFVGGNLLSQGSFEGLYNSKNFREMRGKSFGELVCAGVSAVKWLANKEPEQDRARIRELEDVLADVRAERFILISTIDVYPVLAGEDESYDCHLVKNHAYGANRLAFEDFCRERFETCTVIRLPGLFGPGLKKNVLFDLLNDNCLEMINPACSFQYYALADLSADIRRAVDADVRLLNLFTEPVPTRTILDRFFPGKAVGAKPAGEAHYDLYTRHAGLWGRSGRYVRTQAEVLERMQAFIEHYRRNGRT